MNCARGWQQEQDDTDERAEKRIFDTRLRRVEMNPYLSVNPPRELVDVAERVDELLVVGSVGCSAAAVS